MKRYQKILLVMAGTAFFTWAGIAAVWGRTGSKAAGVCEEKGPGIAPEDTGEMGPRTVRRRGLRRSPLERTVLPWPSE